MAFDLISIASSKEKKERKWTLFTKEKERLYRIGKDEQKKQKKGKKGKEKKRETICRAHVTGSCQAGLRIFVHLPGVVLELRHEYNICEFWSVRYDLGVVKL